MRHLRVAAGLLLAAAGFCTTLAAPLLAQPAMAVQPAMAADWNEQVWLAARSGDSAGFFAALDRAAGIETPAELAPVRDAALKLKADLEAREKLREERIREVNEQLDKALAEPMTDLTLSKSLRSAIELDMVSVERGTAIREPKVRDLTERAAAAAAAAEARGDWLMSAELFALLNGLHEESGRFKPDVERLNDRLSMLRLYVPERLWELRDQRQRAEDQKPLPKYNPLGDNYREKLATIDQTLVYRAVQRAPLQVDRPNLADLLTAGLSSVEVMVTTSDLKGAFPGLADEKARETMLAFLRSEQDALKRMKAEDGVPTAVYIDGLLNRLRRTNEQTVNVWSQALLHEFGNGVMSILDDFSQIIWPDEVRRFERNTRSKFAGVGVQIEFDEQQRIKVVTPLEGTPAQRAGIHQGDVITQVNGKDIFGLSIDQSVDLITGPAGSKVTLTLERTKQEAGGKQEVEVLQKELTRSLISVASVKGWKRQGPRESDWNWFIDEQAGIGYIRLSNFTDESSDELDAALAVMKRQGLKGLIFDLRYNPGGLLDQAIKIGRRFVNVPGGIIVATQGAGGRVENPETSRPEMADLSRLPVVVLINEGSASASEIVAGAVRHYADQGNIDAVVLGQRSFGKGSVQNVWNLTATSMLKLTLQYYMLPDHRIIHRLPGAERWGVEPHLRMEMLPKQTTDSIILRRNADVMTINEDGLVKNATNTPPDPQETLDKGWDLQLQTALLLMRSRVLGRQLAQTPIKP